MSRKIYLIAESREDANVIQALVQAKGFSIRIEWLRLTGGSGGIDRMLAQLEDLIEAALEVKDEQDCIAVCHDKDLLTKPERRKQVHDKIDALCAGNRYRPHVYLIIPDDAIESWLLADHGLCHWLEEKPQNWDGQPDPKAEFKRRLDKKHLKWQGADRAKVLAHLDGSGDKKSPSMQAALTHLVNAPCAKR